MKRTFICYWCGNWYFIDKVTREHIIPIMLKDDIKYKQRFKMKSNVVKACASCNNGRGAVYGIAVCNKDMSITIKRANALEKSGRFRQYDRFVLLERLKLGESILEQETSKRFVALRSLVGCTEFPEWKKLDLAEILARLTA